MLVRAFLVGMRDVKEKQICINMLKEWLYRLGILYFEDSSIIFFQFYPSIFHSLLNMYVLFVLFVVLVIMYIKYNGYFLFILHLRSNTYDSYQKTDNKILGWFRKHIKFVWKHNSALIVMKLWKHNLISIVLFLLAFNISEW